MVQVLLWRHGSRFIVVSVERVDSICRDSDTCCVAETFAGVWRESGSQPPEGQRQVREWLEEGRGKEADFSASLLTIKP